MQIGENKDISNVEKMNFTPVKTEKMTFHGEFAKIKDLGWAYFWNYYKWWVIGIAAFFIAGIFLTYDIIENKRPCLIAGAVYNCHAKGSAETFGEGLAEYMGTDINKEPVKIQLNLEYSTNPLYAENNYAAEMKLEAQVTAKELDFIVGDEALMKAMCRHSGSVSYLADLREALPEDLYDYISDRIIWYENADGGKIPAVIDVSQSKMDEKLQFMQKPVYLGIIANAQHIDNAAGMLEYIFYEK